VLMWFPELDVALRELRRVTRPNGRVVIAIMNPYFYRTGQACDAGDFVIERNLSRPFVIRNHRIAGPWDRLPTITVRFQPISMSASAPG
jgi:SAM-dependent methyltransferase